MGQRVIPNEVERAFDLKQLRALSLREHHRMPWSTIADDIGATEKTVTHWGFRIRRDDAAAHGEQE